jgi:hypothetical protein
VQATTLTIAARFVALKYANVDIIIVRRREPSKLSFGRRGHVMMQRCTYIRLRVKAVVGSFEYLRFVRDCPMSDVVSERDCRV